MKKKITIIGLLLAIAFSVVVASKSKAQHIQFVASFGTTHTWGVPNDIVHNVDYYYPGYNWVHANRITRGRSFGFNIILERGGYFIEVAFDSYGRIVRTEYFDAYPLANHICSGHCGYHTNYYRTYYNSCNSHHHHGHNHVRYRRPVRYTNHRHPVRGNSHPGHYRGNGHHKTNGNNRHYNNARNDGRNNGRSNHQEYKRDDNGSRYAKRSSGSSSSRATTGRNTSSRSSSSKRSSSRNSRGI